MLLESALNSSNGFSVAVGKNRKMTDFWIIVLILIIIWKMIVQPLIRQKEINADRKNQFQTKSGNIDYYYWLRTIIAFKTEQEVLFLGAVAGAAGFFKPNKEKIAECIEKLERIYSDIFSELKQRRDFLLYDSRNLEGYLDWSIKSNLEWINRIKLAAKYNDSLLIINLLSDLDHKMKRDKCLLERWVDELEKKGE